MINATRASLADEVNAFFSLDDQLVSDPYPLYRRLREEAPVFRCADKVLVSRYEDCRTLLSSPIVLQGLAVRGSRFRTAAEQVSEAERVKLAEMFGFLEKRLGGANGQHHQRLRKLAQRAFTPRMVALLEDRIVAIADGLVADLPRDEPVEFIGAFAYHLPLIVISEMLDISIDDRDNLREWASTLGTFVGADWSDASIVEQAHEAVFKLRSYLTDVFDSRRGKPTTDLLAALIAAEGDGGDRFSEDELVAMITQFVFAGHETSTMFLGNALVHLLGDHREQWTMMHSNQSIISVAVDELLRFDSPTHNIDKLAAEEFEVAGVTVRQWDTLTLMLASANRDADVYLDPDRLDITRAGASTHLSFGRGPHHCLGAALARLEAQVSLRMLSERFPAIRLATDQVTWRSTHMNRGPKVLPIVLGPEAD